MGFYKNIICVHLIDYFNKNLNTKLILTTKNITKCLVMLMAINLSYSCDKLLLLNQN